MWPACPAQQDSVLVPRRWCTWPNQTHPPTANAQEADELLGRPPLTASVQGPS